MSTRLGRVKWGAGQPRQRTSEANWRQPVRWNAQRFAECAICGWRGDLALFPFCPSCHAAELQPARRRVFCASLADVFDNEAPQDWLIDLLLMIRRTPSLDWLLLTKRVGNVRKLLEPIAELLPWVGQWLAGNPPANVWLGATVCNQAEADRDVPKLLATPARIRFLSVEPMLGSVDLMEWWLKAPTHCERCDSSGPGGGRDFTTCPWGACPHDTGANRLDWIICGGESGPHARDNNFEECARDLMLQCRAAGVPFFGKQNVGKNPLPEDLRVREFPQ